MVSRISGSAYIATFANPLLLAISTTISIIFATDFEAVRGKIFILSVKRISFRVNLISFSVNNGKFEEIALSKFSNLILMATSVVPYLTHISGIMVSDE